MLDVFNFMDMGFPENLFIPLAFPPAHGQPDTVKIAFRILGLEQELGVESPILIVAINRLAARNFAGGRRVFGQYGLASLPNFLFHPILETEPAGISAINAERSDVGLVNHDRRQRENRDGH